MIKCPRCSGKGEYMREIGGYRPCEYCNGTGELAEQKQTNFDQVTASPEALAAFIADVCYGLLDDVWGNNGDTSCDYPETEKNYWIEWLKQETEE